MSLGLPGCRLGPRPGSGPVGLFLPGQRCGGRVAPVPPAPPPNAGLTGAAQLLAAPGETGDLFFPRIGGSSPRWRRPPQVRAPAALRTRAAGALSAVCSGSVPAAGLRFAADSLTLLRLALLPRFTALSSGCSRCVRCRSPPSIACSPPSIAATSAVAQLLLCPAAGASAPRRFPPRLDAIVPLFARGPATSCARAGPGVHVRSSPPLAASTATRRVLRLRATAGGRRCCGAGPRLRLTSRDPPPHLPSPWWGPP